MAPKYPFDAHEFIKAGKIEEETFNAFKKWCKSQKFPNLSDEQQILCLSCANNLEDAKNIVQKYFKCKSEAPELFSNLDMKDKDLQQVMDVYDICIMPKRTADNAVVACGRLKDTSYSNFHLDQLLKFILMLSECCIYEGPLEGIVVLIDMKGIGVWHLTRIRLSVFQKFAQFVQEGMFYKIKAIHVLNTISVINKVLFILKPFIKTTVYEMIHLHTHDETEEIFKSLPKSYVPEDYGGSLPPLNLLARKTYQKIAELQPLYAALEKQVNIYDEMNNKK